jgi:hypothetical protein
MNDPPDALEAQIIRSWNSNAKPWAKAIQAASIHSRKLVTDQAIVDAVLSVRPAAFSTWAAARAGWREPWAPAGIEVTGIDAVPELIAEAAHGGGGQFQVGDYGAIAQRQLQCGPFDAAVCNFSLLGEESVESLLGAIARLYLYRPSDHSNAASRCGVRRASLPGRLARRELVGLRRGIQRSRALVFPHPGSWVAMLRRSGFELIECREPTAPDCVRPGLRHFHMQDSSSLEQTDRMELATMRIWRLLAASARGLGLTGCVIGYGPVCSSSPSRTR